MAAIHQEVTFKADRKTVYAALTDAKKFSAMSGGAPAEIDAKAGGAFSAFGGKIAGRFIELVPHTLIVQAWRAGNWPAGIYSIARFELKGDGGSTKLVFDHTGFPAEQAPHLEGGWKAMYWQPLAKYLA